MHKNMIDCELVGLLSVRLTWKKVKQIVDETRERFSDPRFYGMFEYLYNEMKKREQTLQAQP
jgi:hypothetical protein